MIQSIAVPEKMAWEEESCIKVTNMAIGSYTII